MKIPPIIRTKTLVWVGAPVLVVALSASACAGDKFSEPFKDAPRAGTDAGAAYVIEQPDGFNNAAAKCIVLDGKKTGVMLVTSYHGDNKYASVSAVASDYCK